MADVTPVEITFERFGRNGAGTVAATAGGVVLHADRIHIAAAKDRERFVAELAERCPGVDAADVADRLLGLLPPTLKVVAPDAAPGEGLGGGGAAPAADRPGPETQAQALLRLAGSTEVFKTPEGRTFARVPVSGHHECNEIRSAAFRRWLTRLFYLEAGRPPTSDAMQGTLGVLESRAQFEGETHAVHVRVASAPDGSVYIDLGDDEWRAVRVGPGGWEVVQNPPVQFRRPGGLRPLPVPVSGARIAELFRFINVEAADRPLVVAWTTAALLPFGPFPVLELSGEQGSAKSTTARVLRRQIDLHASPLRSEPKDPRDLMISATNAWVVALDNLSGIAPWLSDGLCRLATGGGFAARQLYTDSDEVFLDAMLPVILTGIEDVARRGDLADRCVFLHLPAIPEMGRRTEADFWAAFNAAYPRLFGALLDALAGGLRLLPEVALDRLPRMADFARWGEAVWRSLGNDPGAFLTAYERNRRDSTEAVLDDSPAARAVLSFLGDGLGWEGKPSALLAELNRQLTERPAVNDRWPRSARGLAGQLRRLAPALREAGWRVEFKVGRERNMTLSPVGEGDRRAQRARPAPEADLPGSECARCDGDARTSVVRRARENNCSDAAVARCAREAPTPTSDDREEFEP